MHYEFHESLRMFAFVVMVLKVFFFFFSFFKSSLALSYCCDSFVQKYNPQLLC
uniref:Uncharacterized protein n=1 Tax=Anguilla anguilla TaxID=7936 RepID=A0A0E9T795_ANGAN